MKLYAAVYQLAIRAYFAAIYLFAIFNKKASLFIKGREKIFSHIELKLKGNTKRSIWMHCASLGEFEQGRPVLEQLKVLYPEHIIILTFFSPSGYEVRKNYEGADHIFYLPMDSNKNAKQLLDLFQPSLCLFVKYELWYFYLSNIALRKIPLLLISAVFSKEQGFFKWYGGLQRSMLFSFSHIFVQDEASAVLLRHIGLKDVTVSGDTRFDRVISAATNTVPLAIANAFAAGSKILVAGSTWKEDEVLLHKALATLPAEWKIILVPHEVDPNHIAAIRKLFDDDTILWSQLEQGMSPGSKRVLVVDQVGLLLQLYKYGTVAWIGGGFGKEGIHNVLEAAVYGIPCLFGPVYHQFIEAKDLINNNGAIVINDAGALAHSVLLLDDASRYRNQAKAAKDYVWSKSGATEKVVNYIYIYIYKCRMSRGSE